MTCVFLAFSMETIVRLCLIYFSRIIRSHDKILTIEVLSLILLQLFFCLYSHACIISSFFKIFSSTDPKMTCNLHIHYKVQYWKHHNIHLQQCEKRSRTGFADIMSSDFWSTAQRSLTHTSADNGTEARAVALRHLLQHMTKREDAANLNSTYPTLV